SPVPTACFTDSQEPSNNLGVTTNSDESNRVEADVSNMEATITASPTPTFRIHKDHPKSQIIGPVDTLIQTRNKSKEVGEQSFIAIIHQKIDPALLQFCLFSWVRPNGTKWVLQNKKDERGIVIRNKARLVAQGHTQEEGIDYDEVFAPVARIEAIRLFLACASFMGFTVYQMDVKSAFLYGTIYEEVYVMQPPRFQDPEFPSKMYKVEKAMGRIDQTLFIRRQRGDFILVQVHMDDIIFGSSNLQLCREFEALMHEKFQMSAMGELNFFFGLQVLQKEDRIFLSQDKYGKEGTRKDVDLYLYRSMIGSLMYLTPSRPDIMFVVCAYARHQGDSSTQLLSMPCEALSREISSSILCFNKIMARLQFCDYHNMVAILEKSEHNVDFHPIVDFVEASPLMYALTFKPTVYVSYIQQFWSTARIKTTEEGTKILATVDGIIRTVTESSLRRNLKLKDEEGISSLPDAELFENLTLMGYNISPNQKRARIAQSLALLPVANEPASPLRDVIQGEACPNDYVFEVDQDRANIAKTSTLPHESTSRVTSLAADEGIMQHKLDELTALCTSLQRQQSEMVSRFEAQELEINSLKAGIKLLEDKDRGVAEHFGDDAPIKGRRLDVGEEAAERVSDDTAKMATVLTSMDAATILASGVAEVLTGSGSISTAGCRGLGHSHGRCRPLICTPRTQYSAAGQFGGVTAGPPAAKVPTGSDVVPTASLIFAITTVVTSYTRRKGKEKMIEMNVQIARDAKIARIHAEEELQIMIDGLNRSNETVAKYLQEYHQFATELPLERRIELISDLVRYQDNYAKVHKYQSQQRKPWSKKQKRDYYMAVIKSNIGWKEEAERFKRKGIRFDQESVKKLKTSEEEKATDEKVHTEGQRNYWKIIRLGGSSASYQFLLDLLKHLDREDLNQLWALVNESLNIKPASSDKEMELWVELKRLYEPDDEDQLWTHTQNMMHAPVEWKLYDSCRVHHVTSKNNEIFMPIKKDYPLRKGLAIGRIVGNKMHKAFPLPVMEFPLLEEVPTVVKKVPTAKEKQCHCCEDCTATKVKKKLSVRVI
nr:retrovirus-related Pol polyprotein from transposon TNT 1-94 [Tanacetum cinerariifolium]